MTLHRWFESGKYSLLAHADLPQASGQLGVVIVPPFGWEEMCSYRPLRFLARTLAERGLPVLRYDMPGSGDGSGGVLDEGLVEAWIQSIDDAAAELRATAGVQDVALLGVRMGGLLAAIAAGRGADVQDLILWGSASSGRSEMRELRAYANMERWEFGTEDPPPQPVPGFEVGGFLIAPETQRDLEALDVTKVAGLGGRRVLILSRDDVAGDAKLVRAFESAGCEVRAGTGAGYSAMMTMPHEAVAPTAAAQTIAEFLAGPQRVRTVCAKPGPQLAMVDHAVRETIFLSESEKMFGILAEPAHGARSKCCILFLNAGGVRHTGPNRLWVDAARTAATEGFASLRMDLCGIGESEGEECLDIPALYQERLVQQVEQAMATLRSRRGFEQFAVIGLCAGAFWAFHAAARNRDIASAILFNPRLFFWDPEVDRRRLVRRGARGIVSLKDWLRLLRGGFHLKDLKRALDIVLAKSRDGLTGTFSQRQIPARKLAEAWNKIRRNRARVTLVFTEGEPLLQEMEDERQMPPEHVKLVRVPKCGHTFRPQWSQRIVNDLIRSEIDILVSERRADRVVRAR